MPDRPHPWVLAESTWKEVASTRWEVALLPWGATEPHNTHLPYGTDTYQTVRIAERAARRAWEAGARVAVLPAIPFGTQTGQLDLPFALNLNPSTQFRVLRDLARSLHGQGVRRLLLLNGHGGNELRGLVRELQGELDLLILLVDWYRLVDPSAYFDEPGDHAGEMETSLMLAIHPELVDPLEGAGDGRALPARLEGVREGWAWTPRRWSRVTEDTGVGDPRQATAQKGERFLVELESRLANLLVELARTDPEEFYGP